MISEVFAMVRLRRLPERHAEVRQERLRLLVRLAPWCTMMMSIPRTLSTLS